MERVPIVSLVGLLIGGSSLLLTIYNRHVLSQRIENLELERRTGLFTVTKPRDGRDGDQLVARQPIMLQGTYVDLIPPNNKVRAVISIGGWYYVSRNRPELVSGRSWSLEIYPWPGTNKVHVCLADATGTAEIDKWAAELNSAGTLNWENPRKDLPPGVRINSTFEYTAAERKQGAK